MSRSRKTVKDKLDEALEVVNERLEMEDEEVVALLPPASKQLIMASRPDEIHPETQEDYEYARAIYKDLVEKGNEALEGIMELAEESDSPRNYEVVGELISTISDVVTASIILQEKMEELRKKEAKTFPTNNQASNNGDTNFIFTGSNSDILDVIAKAKRVNKDG